MSAANYFGRKNLEKQRATYESLLALNYGEFESVELPEYHKVLAENLIFNNSLEVKPLYVFSTVEEGGCLYHTILNDGISILIVCEHFNFSSTQLSYRLTKNRKIKEPFYASMDNYDVVSVEGINIALSEEAQQRVRKIEPVHVELSSSALLLHLAIDGDVCIENKVNELFLFASFILKQDSYRIE